MLSDGHLASSCRGKSVFAEEREMGRNKYRCGHGLRIPQYRAIPMEHSRIHLAMIELGYRRMSKICSPGSRREADQGGHPKGSKDREQVRRTIPPELLW